jgi:hypothetical protein
MCVHPRAKWCTYSTLGPVYEMLRFAGNLEECRKVQFAKQVLLIAPWLTHFHRISTGSVIQIFFNLIVTFHKRLVDRWKRQSHTLWSLRQLYSPTGGN